MSDDVLTVDEFLATCDYEGVGYTVAHYYGRNKLETIPNEDIRDAALRAHDALNELDSYVEGLDWDPDAF